MMRFRADLRALAVVSTPGKMLSFSPAISLSKLWSLGPLGKWWQPSQDSSGKEADRVAKPFYSLAVP